MPRAAQAAIIIPARYGSSRFEGKPLALLAGKPMLLHVYARACMARDALRKTHKDIDLTIAVATDDDRIASLCSAEGIDFVMTSSSVLTGSDRVMEALDSLNAQRGKVGAPEIEVVLNLQGDNPFASIDAIISVLNDLITNPDHMVATPVLPLSWRDLDILRSQKLAAPFSGTTVTIGKNAKALWFSKHIIPAIRKESKLREGGDDTQISPVFRHIGLYGYRVQALREFVSLPESRCEGLEGLEQLRFLENDIHIYTVEIPAGSMPPISGIDSPEDLAHALDLIEQGVITLPKFNNQFE